MAAHSFEPDGSLHLIVREADSNLREFWWTDTTGGSGKLTGNGMPPTVTPVFDGQYLGSVASYVTRADGRQHVVYVTQDRQLWELSWLGNQPAQGANLLAQTLAPRPNPYLSAYVGHDGSQHVIYLDQFRRVIELQWSGNAVPVAQVAGGDAGHGGFPADSKPICSHVYPFDGNSQHAFYLSGGEIIELRKAMGEDRQARSLTRISSGAPPLAVSGPASLVAADGTQHVFYLAASGEIIELWWRGNDAPQAENLTQQAHAPLAHADSEGFTPPLASHYVQFEDTQHVFSPTHSSAPRGRSGGAAPGPRPRRTSPSSPARRRLTLRPRSTAWSPPTGTSMSSLRPTTQKPQGFLISSPARNVVRPSGNNGTPSGGWRIRTAALRVTASLL
jgi:hypothetical protein